jgi:hypothetical protein
MNNSRDFIDSIENGENLEAESHFSDALSDKVGASLENRRQELAYELVNEGGPEMQRAAMQVGKQASETDKKGKYTPQAKMQQDRDVASSADTNVKMAKTVKKYVASDPKLSRSKGMGNMANKAVKVNVQAREKMTSKKGPGAGAILRGRKTSEKMGTDRSGYGSKSELDIGSQTALQRQVTKNKNKEAKANRSGGDDDVA